MPEPQQAKIVSIEEIVQEMNHDAKLASIERHLDGVAKMLGQYYKGMVGNGVPRTVAADCLFQFHDVIWGLTTGADEDDDCPECVE